MERVNTICPYCGTGCGMYLKVSGGKVIGIDPVPNHPVNRFKLCIKGWTAHEFIHHPDRLKTPLIKEGGAFREASWDEALTFTAKGFEEIRERIGGKALGVVSSSRTTNEENYLAQKLARAVFSTNNVDNCARTCHSPSVAGLNMAFGSGAMTGSYRDIEGAELIFIIGANPYEAHPVLAERIINAVDRGAILIVADPRETPLVDFASIHLPLRPGTDIPLINAMIRTILEEGLADRKFISDRTEGFEALEKAVSKYSPASAEETTGVPAGDIVEAARLYGGKEKSLIIYGLGITEHTSGTDNVLALANLAMAAGKVGKPFTGIFPLRGQNNVQGACDMGTLPKTFPGYQPVEIEETRKKFEKAWGRTLPAEARLTCTDMYMAARRGNLKGLYIIGEDILMNEPNYQLMKESLKELDLLVVQDIFMSETAKLAHVVLPAASFAEKDGTFTNAERRVQLIRKAVEPPGKALPDWEIICRLSGKMGYQMTYNNSSEIMDEIASLTPLYGGISHKRLGVHGLQWPCPDKDHPGTSIMHKEEFKRGKGKFFPVAHREPAETVDDEYPFILSTGRILFQHCAGTMTRRTRAIEREHPRNFVMINDEDSKSIGVRNGEDVLVSTRRGELKVEASVTGRIRKGVIWMPFHYSESPTNMLTNDAFDVLARIAEYKACAAKVLKA